MPLHCFVCVAPLCRMCRSIVSYVSLHCVLCVAPLFRMCRPGFYVETLHTDWTTFNASNYGALLLLDPEEPHLAREVRPPGQEPSAASCSSLWGTKIWAAGHGMLLSDPPGDKAASRHYKAWAGIGSRPVHEETPRLSAGIGSRLAREGASRLSALAAALRVKGLLGSWLSAGGFSPEILPRCPRRTPRSTTVAAR